LVDAARTVVLARVVVRLLREPGGRPRRLAVGPLPAAVFAELLLAGLFLAVVRLVVVRLRVVDVLARRPALARLLVVARLGAGGVLPSDALGCSAIRQMSSAVMVVSGQHKQSQKYLR
jgi:hypothetical protein